jgi:hypothetical protein
MSLWKRVLLTVTGPIAVALLLALVSAPPALTQAGGRVQSPAKPLPPGPPPQPVLVTNTPLPTRILNGPNEPVPVSVQGGNELQPFQKQLLELTEFDSLTLSFDIPAGKRLFIETVMVSATVPGGLGQRVSASIQGSFQGENFFSNLAIPFISTVAGRDQFIGNHPIRLITDDQGGGQDLAILFSRAVVGNNANRLAASATVFGHLASP